MADQNGNNDSDADVQGFVAHLGFVPLKPRLPAWEEEGYRKLFRAVDVMMLTPEYEVLIARFRAGELTTPVCRREIVKLMGQLQREGRLPASPHPRDPTASPIDPDPTI